MSAIISPCGLFRYRLERDLQAPHLGGPIVALIGVNPSTADAVINDPTIRKELGFGQRLGWSKIIKGNVFAFRTSKVRELTDAADPWGPDNGQHLVQILRDADLVIPCWGDRGKLHKGLRPWLDTMKPMLVRCGKPIRIFGLTQSGDPMHPLMLAYNTPLVPWHGLS